MRGGQVIETWMDRIHATTSVISSLLITAIVVLMSVDVIMRTFFGGGLRGVIEIGELALVIGVYAAMGVAQKEGRHVAISMVTARFPPRVQRWLRRSSLLVASVFILWAIWQTGILGLESMRAGEIRFGVLGVWVWPGRLAIPIGLIWLQLEVIRQIINPEEGRGEPETISGI